MEGMLHQLLLSADLMVHDADHVADLLVTKLGLAGHPNWRQAFPGHPYVAHFLRAHKSLAVSPTRIEPQGHLDAPNAGDPMFPVYLRSIEEFQGPSRPQKTHATVIVTDDMDGVIKRLMAKKQPFRLARLTPEMPFDRLWVGCTPEKPGYEPSVDGGLCIEFIPLGPIMMPDLAFSDPPPQPRDSKPGDMVRVVARGFLVRDLDDVLARLDDNLDLRPSEPAREIASEGYRIARLGFGLKHSATFDLIEPTQWDSDAGRYLHNWGPGPYYARIAVTGLKAKADDLTSRGVKFEWREHSDAVDGSLIRVDPAELDGAIFEFVEHKA